MEKQGAYELFKKYLHDRATPAELNVFFDYLNEPGAEKQVSTWINEQLDKQQHPNSQKLVSLLAGVDRRMHQSVFQHAAQLSSPGNRSRRRWLWPATAAAAILFIASAILWRYAYHVADSGIVEDHRFGYQNDVLPASIGASLTFADGRTIQLDSFVASSALPVDPAGGDFRLVVPHGKTFLTTLPDGSTVRLNAGTSLQYGEDFNKTERRISITGEAFFDVVHAPDKPFRVIVQDKTIEVLGTRFNVDAYGSEVNTTLVEGRVKIINQSATQFLTSGQLAVSTTKNTVVSDVDVTHSIAWTNGDFHFDGESIHHVMNELARWYNLDITYSGTMPAKKIKGTIGRNVRLAEVLTMLNGVTGCTFHIKGRTLSVINN